MIKGTPLGVPAIISSVCAKNAGRRDIDGPPLRLLYCTQRNQFFFGGMASRLDFDASSGCPSRSLNSDNAEAIYAA